jgi:YidC/Oxa1 family membrane protein insertase
MDTQRLILFAIFSFSLLFLWERWQAEQRPPTPPAAKAGSEATSPSAPKSAGGATTPTAAVPSGATGAASGERIEIKTDRFVAVVDTLGGVITQLALTDHRDTEDAAKPYRLLQQNENRTFIAQAGLIGDGLPAHRTLWQALPGPRELAPGADKLELKLAATAANGDKVVQTLEFHRGSYLIDVGFDITNSSSSAVSPYAYFQLTRDTKTPVQQSSWAPSSYTGPVLYNEADKFQKVNFPDIDKAVSACAQVPSADSPSCIANKAKFAEKADNGWIGMIEHYFVAAWLPPEATKTTREFYVKKLDNGLYADGVILPMGAIAPGASASVVVPLYAGPQEQGTLEALAPGLDRVVDYGYFRLIAEPLFLLLKWLHSLIGNWGWAIIAMTIIIKSAFYPLNHASARSMAKMKVVAPKMKALQEQYANDKQQLQIKMMELYKAEKINPLGGCLPILVQIPVFIALYWVLLSAVELRHAPWIGWIHDLSAPDPYWVLPIVYAVTAYLQVKLSPTPIQDPVQAKVMQIMPIAFSVMFIVFPSGLVLYWLINNAIQIFQQWHMNRVLTREAAAAAAKRR